MLAVTLAATGPAVALDPDPDVAAIAARQSQANHAAGPRQVPARSLPVPQADVSPQMQAAIATPYWPGFDTRPRSAAEWKAFVGSIAEGQAKLLPALKDSLGVTVEPSTIAGVPVFVVTPKAIPEANRDRLVLHMHGGGYVLNPGETGAIEAMLIAAHAGYKVVSVDYRMPPDAPYPAALDDCIAVWKELAGRTDPARVAFAGTSTGGGLVLAAALRARDEKLPMPGALAAGSPWADMTKTGDSVFANEWVDNILVTYDGWLGDAARLYAAGQDLKQPYLSPLYADFTGLPPTILTSGTRDLFLSDTVRVHRKLRRAGIAADLHVYEGMSHAIFLDASLPESREIFEEVGRFLDRQLKR
jgi:acetyl esterase/lipase